MSTLRELFVSIQFKGNAAKELEKVDKAADGTAKQVKNVDKAADDASKSMEKLGKSVIAAKQGLGNLADFAKASFAVLAAGTTAIVAATKSWTDHAQQLGRTADQYGLSVESLQELTYAAEALGGEGDAVVEVIKEMAIRLNEFELTGAGPASDAIKTLGLNIKDLKGLSPDKQFEVLAQKISEVADAGQRIFLKDSLFGEEGGIKIGTLLEQGADGIRALREEARSLGFVMGKDAVDKANKFNREFLRVKSIAQGVRNDIASGLLPVIEDLVVRLGEWAKKNRELITERVTAGLRKFIEYAEKLLPLLGDAIDLVVKLVDKVGGIENALKIAAGGWVAFKLAGLAAMGELGVALAALGLGVAGAMAIAASLTNINGITSNAKAAKQANATIKRLTKAYDETGDPELLGLLQLAQEQTRLIADPDLSAGKAESINAITDVLIQELARRNISVDEAKPAGAGKPKSLRKIAKPGEKPVTLQSLLNDERKAGRDRDKLREIRRQAEEMRVNTEGADRVALDSVIGGINSKLGQGAYKNINELLAEAIGQDTGLAGAQLKPAGLGTTINNIDASITVNMGGIEVELPASIANAHSPAIAGEIAGQSVLSEVRTWIERAFRDQRSQIIG